MRAVRVDEMDVAGFISHLGRLGIPAIRLSATETEVDLDTLEQWLQSQQGCSLSCGAVIRTRRTCLPAPP